MQIDFISDVACPWCAVGLHSLDKALAELGAEVPVTLRFQPFELNPTMGPEGDSIVAYLGRKYGISEAQIRQNQVAIRERGAAVGFQFGERNRVWNTFDAHRLLHWAGLQGGDRQHALKRALLQAYHGEGRNPGDPAVLVELATQVGLDAAQAREILAGDLYAAEVRAAEREWAEAGIQSVPSVVINGRHLIQGAQPPEVFMQALRQLATQPA